MTSTVTTLTTAQTIDAIFATPALYELARVLEPGEWDGPGRPRLHAPYLLLGMAVLARGYRSLNRVEAELRDPHVWAHVRAAAGKGRDQHAPDLAAPGLQPPRWHHWRWLRDQHLTSDEGIADLRAAFLSASVETAHRLGLLLPGGPGSLTHPDVTRLVYGDGTIIKPIYRPATDEERQTATARRTDPDTAMHMGHDGAKWGTGYVFMHVRGPRPQQRLVLTVDAIPRPGLEAETAVRLAGEVKTVAGDGMLGLVYDGALRGVHLDRLMRDDGLVVLAPMAQLSSGPRLHPLGAWAHERGRTSCSHVLVAVDGQVCEATLDETGETAYTPLPRRQIKRHRRAAGYHFTAGYDLSCRGVSTVVWVSPHSEPGDRDATRAERVRLFPPADPDYHQLRGVRSNAESFHSHLKRAMWSGRAMSLGWRRGLIDNLAFALLVNARAEYALQLADQPKRGLRLVA